MGHRDVNCSSGQLLKQAFNIVASGKAMILGFMLIISTSWSASAAELQVPVNETKVFVLEQAVATIAVTNPAIADVTIHNETTILVIGRTYGTTNLIALDDDGKPVATKRIRVVSPIASGSVTYVRGADMQSYSCSPRCERVVLPGDSK